jgi:hypothetical protein
MLRESLLEGSLAQQEWLAKIWETDIILTLWRRAVNRVSAVNRAIAGEYHLSSVEHNFPLRASVVSLDGMFIIAQDFGNGVTIALPDLEPGTLDEVVLALSGNAPIPVHRELLGSAKHRLGSDEARLAFLDGFAACETLVRTVVDGALQRKYSEGELKALLAKDTFEHYRTVLYDVVFAAPLSTWNKLPPFVEKVQKKRNKVTHQAESVTYAEAAEALQLSEEFILYLEAQNPKF